MIRFVRGIPRSEREREGELVGLQAHGEDRSSRTPTVRVAARPAAAARSHAQGSMRLGCGLGVRQPVRPRRHSRRSPASRRRFGDERRIAGNELSDSSGPH